MERISRMDEIIKNVLLMLSWYGIGILSMVYIQHWIDELTIDETSLYPHRRISGPKIGMKEIWVLGLCGPFVTVAAIYFTVLIWWLTRNDND